MSRPKFTTRTAITAVCVGLLVATAVSGTSTTYASWSDTQTIPMQAGAGVWAPDSPASCSPLSSCNGVVEGGGRDDLSDGGSASQLQPPAAAPQPAPADQAEVAEAPTSSLVADQAPTGPPEPSQTTDPLSPSPPTGEATGAVSPAVPVVESSGTPSPTALVDEPLFP